MDAVDNYPQRTTNAEPLLARRSRRLGCRYPLLCALAAFGSLAFIFSAISPDDDDIQQESLQSSKYVLANYKAVPNLRTLRICTVRSALAPPTSQFVSYYVTARISVPGDEIKSRVFNSRTGDRSPPTKSL
jgi:hypothetical protein